MMVMMVVMMMVVSNYCRSRGTVAVAVVLSAVGRHVYSGFRIWVLQELIFGASGASGF